MTPEEQRQRFDEKAALAELERLRESIQAARQARQRTSAEFEAFIKGFRSPASTLISELPPAISGSSEAPQQVMTESIDHAVESPDPPPSTIGVPSKTASFDERPRLTPSHRLRRYRLDIRSLGILVIIAVIAVGLVSIRWRREISPPETIKAVGDNAPLTPNAAASPAAPAQSTPASPAAHPVAIDLRVLRPVWMRVVVDGRKDVEATVQAGEPLHFTAEHSIVVRVGNGGDVLVKTGTREESFGETGQPRTRTFAKP